MQVAYSPIFWSQRILKNSKKKKKTSTENSAFYISTFKIKEVFGKILCTMKISNWVKALL